MKTLNCTLKKKKKIEMQFWRIMWKPENQTSASLKYHV